jgi:negative regulator of genetic competence, sporulation and motility
MREAYVLIDPDTDVDTSETYEFVGEAEECPGEEKPPFEFLKVTLSPADMDEWMEGVSDIDVLNFVSTLEHLEANYYNQFLDEYSEQEVERSEAARIFADAGSRFSTY